MKDSARFDVPLRAFEDVAALFRLLSTPGRLRIVDALCAGEKDVVELLADTRVAPPELSEHLGLLSRAGLVLPRHLGGRLCYRIADDCAGLVCQAVGSMLAQGEDETGVGGPSIQYVTEDVDSVESREGARMRLERARVKRSARMGLPQPELRSVSWHSPDYRSTT